MRKLLVIVMLTTVLFSIGCGEIDCTEVIKEEWREYPSHHYGKPYRKVIQEKTCRETKNFRRLL